jgi:hypothetical protein
MTGERPPRVEAERLGAGGEDQRFVAGLVIGPPGKFLEEVPLSNAHHRLPSLPAWPQS